MKPQRTIDSRPTDGEKQHETGSKTGEPELSSLYLSEKDLSPVPQSSHRLHGDTFKALTENAELTELGVSPALLLELTNTCGRVARGVYERHLESSLRDQSFKFMFQLVQAIKIRLKREEIENAEIAYSLGPLAQLFRDCVRGLAPDFGEWLQDDEECQLEFLDAWQAVDEEKLTRTVQHYFEMGRNDPVTLLHPLNSNQRVRLVASACFYAARKKNPFQLCTETVGAEFAQGSATTLRKVGSRILRELKRMGLISVVEEAEIGKCELLRFNFDSKMYQRPLRDVTNSQSL